MGVYSEYLSSFRGDFQALTAERKRQLARIGALRQRDVLVVAANLVNSRQPTAINYSDLLPFSDQLANLPGLNSSIDLILETPGGSGEVVEDMVKLLRSRYSEIGVIVPGAAKSAGTILAMAADEILMEPVSSLGPIDAQMFANGKSFSAHALLEGMKKIMAEVSDSGLNRAYIPILQNISPGELQHAQNAFDFARDLVTDWLNTYKFRRWTIHSSTQLPVTPEQRRERAQEVAEALRDHGRWKTHGRSIKIEDLRQMKLQITDYSEQIELADAIRRYYTLLQMTFDSNIYKLFETAASQIVRFEPVNVGQPAGKTPPGEMRKAALDVKCKKCEAVNKVEALLHPAAERSESALPFPADNKLTCPRCGDTMDLTGVRLQIEAQTKRKVL